MSLRIRGFHLPPLGDRTPAELRTFGGAEVELPTLSPPQLRAAIESTRHVAAHILPSRSVDDILSVIDRVVTNWLQPSYHLRQYAEQVLPLTTGFSREMIRHGLSLLLSPLRGETLRALLDDELGDRHVLDRLCNGRYARGPSLITHVLSGNIPALAAAPMLLSLAIKSVALLKSASGDPVSAALLATSLSEVDPDLGRCVLVTHWRGGSRDIEEIAFRDAALVVASGSDDSISAIAAMRPTRFIGHGHKISFAIIGRERLADSTAQQVARDLAYDVSLWDQQGCLSPQLCYLESGGSVTPLEFAKLLADELAQLARDLPPRQLSFDEKAQILRFRADTEWSRGTVLASADTPDWSISVEPNLELAPSCLSRCIRLKSFDHFDELSLAIAPHRRHLEAVGMAVNRQRVRELTQRLAACGVHRVCPLGRMQIPDVAWRQSGRPRIAEWVEWTLVEQPTSGDEE